MPARLELPRTGGLSRAWRWRLGVLALLFATELALAGVRFVLAPHIWQSPEDRECQQAGESYARLKGIDFRRARFDSSSYRIICGHWSLLNW